MSNLIIELCLIFSVPFIVGGAGWLILWEVMPMTKEEIEEKERRKQ